MCACAQNDELCKQIFNWLVGERAMVTRCTACCCNAYEWLNVKCSCSRMCARVLMRARHLNCDWICLGCSSNNAHLLVNYLSFPLHVSHSRVFRIRNWPHLALAAVQCDFMSLTFAQPIACRQLYAFHILCTHTNTPFLFSLSM